MNEELLDLLSAARSALDQAREALALFNERRPDILLEHPTFTIEGLRLERARESAVTRRGLIGAQAFLGNLVIVEKCIRRMVEVTDKSAPARQAMSDAGKTISAMVDRQVRNTAEHIDERVLSFAGKGLIVSSIFEGDLLCSTRPDGSLGRVEISEATWWAVHDALYGIFYSPEQLAALKSR